MTPTPSTPSDSSASGVVFDIKEFALFDGPGIRTTVFLKGCPLRCAWCHNPEGLSPEPETLRCQAGTRPVGQRYTAAALATRLNGQASILRDAGGGITFSGGEPLLQAAFVDAVIARLDHLHVVLDTSGYGDAGSFRRLLALVDLVYFDLKLMDSRLHEQYTGCGNEPILRNLGILAASKRACVVRVPLVPGVTDTSANLDAVAQCCRGIAGLVRVDLLPYNRAAGGKYEACNRRFIPRWDEAQPVNAELTAFRQAGIEARVV